MSDMASEYYVINSHVLNTKIQILYYDDTNDSNKIIGSHCATKGWKLVWASMGGPVSTRVFLRRLRPAKSLLQDKNIGGIFSFMSVNFGRVCMHNTYSTHRSGITDWWWASLQELATVCLVMNAVVSMHMSDDRPHTWWVLLLVMFIVWPP